MLIHQAAGLRFPPTAGVLDRHAVEVYDEAANDVGVTYRGKYVTAPARCLYVLNVFVYPAHDPIQEHLEKVKTHLLKRSPDAKPAPRIVQLDGASAGTGAHAAFTDTINSLPAFEQVSLYLRGGWFVKYRITLGPDGPDVCEGKVNESIRDLQSASP